jgi:predicted dehydrogenase
LGKIRIGVVGMGVMGEAHAKIYQRNNTVELVGCVEMSKQRGDQIAKIFRIPVCETMDELLDMGVDAVSICTPDHLHKDFVIKAFSRKVKVLVEKPFDISYQACEEMIQARPDPTYLMVGHDLRFDARIVQAKKAYESGKIGKLLYINARRCNSVSSCDRISDRTSVTWFLGIHDIDAALWVTGLEAEEVISAAGFRYYSNTWDCVTAAVRLKGGALLQLDTHWIHPNASIKGSDLWFKMIGSMGSIDLDMSHHEAAFTYSNESAGYFDTHYQPEDLQGIPSGDLRYQLEHFIDCVRFNQVPLTTGEEALKAVRVIEQIEKRLDTTGYRISD